MIPFVKLYTRRFHVTSKVFLRKIAPKSSSSNLKHEFPENNSSSCEDFSPDYLGIESDENVITVNPQTHRIQQSEISDNREKFYRACFGIVRFDADNKPKYHGQYKRRKEFLFPYTSSEAMKVSNISEILSSKTQHQDLSLKNSQVCIANTLNENTKDSTSSVKDNHDLGYIDDCYFDTSVNQNNMKQAATEELNYIEKNYFEALVHSKNLSLEQDTSENIDSKEKNVSSFCNKNELEELNYLEKDSFEVYIKSKEDYSNQVDGDHLEQSNRFKKDSFEALCNSQNPPVNQNVTTCSDYEKVVNSAFDGENENTFLKTNFTSGTDELNFFDKSLLENCSSSNVQNSAHLEDLLNSSSHFQINNNINEEKNSKCYEGNQDGKLKNEKEISNVIYTDESVNDLNEKKSHKTNLKKFSSSKTQKCDTISFKSIQPSEKDSNLLKELHNDSKSVKSFSVQNSFKFSKPVSEEPDPSNQISTAHDFVKKLREEQKIPSVIQISKEKSTKEEKLDSKGFRILANQVPNLAYFTRDEILNILKQNVVYSDNDLLILNKPYNLVMDESKTTKDHCLSTFLDDLAKELDKQSINPKLFTVHRLDKETTGCVLLARNENMAMHLKALFAQRKIVKKYWIITSGVPDPLEGVIDIPISEGSINNKKRMVLHPKLPKDIPYKNHSKSGKPAMTTYKVIGEVGNAALVEVFPKTGVKHQIRVHFGFGLGCPILGDHKYSHLDKLAPQKLPSDILQRLHVRQSKVRYIPMHIHAKSIGIPEYFDKRDLFVNIPIPDYFKLNLKRLNFRKKDLRH